MKAVKIIIASGAIVCETLSVLFLTLSLPFVLVRDALTAMAATSKKAADAILGN